MSVNLQSVALPRRIDTIERRGKGNTRLHIERRKAVLEMLCAGVCQKRIASTLGISQGDVSYCICQVMKQLGCKTHAQLGVIASRKGLV